MNKVGIRAIKKPASPATADAESAPKASGKVLLSEEDKSKDAFFVQVAELADAMIAKHGKDFAIGTLVLSAKFIVEGKPLIGRPNG